MSKGLIKKKIYEQKLCHGQSHKYVHHEYTFDQRFVLYIFSPIQYLSLLGLGSVFVSLSPRSNMLKEAIKTRKTDPNRRDSVKTGQIYDYVDFFFEVI